MKRINIGCGSSPTAGWNNFDNSLSVRLATKQKAKRMMSGLEN